MHSSRAAAGHADKPAKGCAPGRARWSVRQPYIRGTGGAGNGETVHEIPGGRCAVRRSGPKDDRRSTSASVPVRLAKRWMRSTSFPRLSCSIPVMRRTRLRRSFQACSVSAPWRRSRAKLSGPNREQLFAGLGQHRLPAGGEETLDGLANFDHGTDIPEGGSRTASTTGAAEACATLVIVRCSAKN